MEKWFPFLDDMRGYGMRLLRADALAGLTVAVCTAPQALAYAMVAGVPPVHGLYAAVVMGIVAALWGSSAYLNTGPTNSAAILFASALAGCAVAGADPVAAGFVVCILAGTLKLAMGFLRLGKLTEFIPEPVLLGFTVGSGILIPLFQFHHLLGIPRPEAAGATGRVWELAGNLGSATPGALVFGILTIALMFFFGRHKRRGPLALLVVAAVTALAEAAVLMTPALQTLRVGDVQQIPMGFPSPAWVFAPPAMWQGLLLPSVLIALVGLVEAVSIGNSLALRHGKALDFNAEFRGQGLSMLASALFRGFPGSGSFSRSVMTEQAGGETRFATVFYGLFTALVLTVPGLLNRIPLCVLAGLLVHIGWRLIDTHRMRQVWNTSVTDSASMLITLGVMLFLKIEYGIFAGVLAAFLLHAYRTRELRLTELVPDGAGGFRELPYAPGVAHEASDVVVLDAGGDLFFGVSYLLRARLREVLETQQPLYPVLRMRHTFTVDYACWNVIFDFAEAVKRRGGELYICGSGMDVAALVRKVGLKDVVEPRQICSRTDAVFRSLRTTLGVIRDRLDSDARLSSKWICAFSEQGGWEHRDGVGSGI
jgi:SulP family sulfate permease